MANNPTDEVNNAVSVAAGTGGNGDPNNYVYSSSQNNTNPDEFGSGQQGAGVSSGAYTNNDIELVFPRSNNEEGGEGTPAIDPRQYRRAMQFRNDLMNIMLGLRPNRIRHVVGSGDTLWDIAKKFTGSGMNWPSILQANPQISDPNKIFPGQVIEIPNAENWSFNDTANLTNQAARQINPDAYTTSNIPNSLKSVVHKKKPPTQTPVWSDTSWLSQFEGTQTGFDYLLNRPTPNTGLPYSNEYFFANENTIYSTGVSFLLLEATAVVGLGINGGYVVSGRGNAWDAAGVTLFKYQDATLSYINDIQNSESVLGAEASVSANVGVDFTHKTFEETLANTNMNVPIPLKLKKLKVFGFSIGTNFKSYVQLGVGVGVGLSVTSTSPTITESYSLSRAESARVGRMIDDLNRHGKINPDYDSVKFLTRQIGIGESGQMVYELQVLFYGQPYATGIRLTRTTPIGSESARYQSINYSLNSSLIK
ncbi:MAG: LysM peptidoglycan-binding domain-containing protein [Chitinophagales bacterium]|nr:LysM peptidoglycan-binding domain-containing protein [Chitinophagales bacterium]